MTNAHPRATPSSSAWHDQDIYASMNRVPSNATSNNQRPMSGVGSPNVGRNGYNGHGEKPVPVPGSSGFYGNGADRNGGVVPGPPQFDMARSPPGGASKNTKHVPCKFFRQGTCQAGNACPFSHSMDPMTQQAPCKYFMKGNCKFGAKCALAHYLPDGRRVNRAELDAGMAMAGAGAGRPSYYGSRGDPSPFPNPEHPLSDSMLPQSPYGPEYFATPGFPLMEPDEPDAFQDRYNQYQVTPHFDSALNSPPTSQFGSPPNESYFPKSPVENLRTALNAPLPQSFDSNGISHIAKYGPLGQSVPDKFGMRSPASSSLSRQLGSPADSVSAFRNTALGSNLRNASPLAASPQNNDESIGQRIMHSQKASKPRVLSASVPRSNLPHDWEEGFGLETDLLPNSLHDEVLTPQEKMRRLSRPEQDTTGVAIPSGTSSKVGSPPTAGSPSRFSALWAEQREKKAAAETTGAPALGHVGSPLRESWMPTGSYDGSRGGQISGISQAMARLQLNRTESSEYNAGRPAAPAVRHSSAPIGRFDRTISSPGLTSRKIEEEGEGVFFPMDDEKRSSSNFSGLSPRIAPLREKSNGDISRLKRDDASIGFAEKPIFGFRS